MPTEAEWEFACRAGGTTANPFEDNEDLYESYCWYTKVSRDKATLPIGSVKPNEWGLFDMQGNVAEWCQEQIRYCRSYNETISMDDKEDMSTISDRNSRVLRGGAFSTLPRYMRAANRGRIQPTYRNENVGLRPARTFS